MRLYNADARAEDALVCTESQQLQEEVQQAIADAQNGYKKRLDAHHCDRDVLKAGKIVVM